MKKLISIIVLAVLVSLTGCRDPATKGELMIYNETDKPITVKYCSDKIDNRTVCDTLKVDIQPFTSSTLKVFQQHGKAKKFHCCPCDIDIHSITSILGPIKKDPSIENNWSISNKNQLKNNGGPAVKCEFHISQEDL